MSRDARSQGCRTGFKVMLGLGAIVIASFVRSVMHRLPANQTGHPRALNNSIPSSALAGESNNITRDANQPGSKISIESLSPSSYDLRSNSSKRRSWWTSISAEFQWLALLVVATVLSVYGFKHIPGPPPNIGTPVIVAPTVAVDTPQVPSSIIWEAGEFPCIYNGKTSTCSETDKYLSLDVGFGTTNKHPLVHWAIEMQSFVPLRIRPNEESQSLSWLIREHMGGSGVDRVITPNNCGVNPQSNSGIECDNLITGWSYLTSVSSRQTNPSGPTLSYTDFQLKFNITWGGSYPTWTQEGAYLKVALPDTAVQIYGINPDFPSGGWAIGVQPRGAEWAGGGFVHALDHLPWTPYWPSSVSVSSFYEAIQAQEELNNYQIISGVIPQATHHTWAWLTQGEPAAAVGQDLSTALYAQQLLFWVGIALGVAGSAMVAAIQVFVGLRIEAHHRGTTEPLALIAAILAAGMAVYYLWLLHQHIVSNSLGFPIALFAGASFAAYGAFWRAPRRLTALWTAVVVLAVFGGAEAAFIVYIGLPIVASGALLLASILRRRPHATR